MLLLLSKLLVTNDIDRDYADQDGTSIEFDSYMIPESDLEAGDLRLLEVDNQLVVPTNTHVRCILTAADVIHC
jgi:cytochrome c oxidase subunit 2